jgi:hypothetical protein
VTAIRTALLMAALLGPLSLTTAAAAQGAGATAPVAPLPSTTPPPQSPFAPQPYAPPPGYSALPMPMPMQLVALPRTLPYREHQPAPLGYRMETRSNGGLMISGGVILSSAWALSAFIGGIILSEAGHDSSGYSPLLVPIIGPFITLGTGADVDLSRDNDRPIVALILFNGITQATGLALLVGGIASDQKYWVRNDIPRSASLRPPEILVGPGGGALRFRF